MSSTTVRVGTGIFTVTRRPPPGFAVAATLPPCAWATDRTIDSPRPAPVRWAVVGVSVLAVPGIGAAVAVTG